MIPFLHYLKKSLLDGPQWDLHHKLTAIFHSPTSTEGKLGEEMKPHFPSGNVNLHPHKNIDKRELQAYGLTISLLYHCMVGLKVIIKIFNPLIGVTKQIAL